jgi:hypothetical protein
MLRKTLILGALLVAVAAAGIGYAAIPHSSTGVISACKDNKGTLKAIDAEAGQICNANQQPLSWNQQGPQGPAGAQGPAGPQGSVGPAGPSGVILSGQAVALGKSPTATTQFLTPAVQLPVVAGQKVLVVANKAFGTLVHPANGLDLYPCYQSTLFGSPIVTLGSGILNNAMPANSRITMGISHVIAGLNTGSYNFGMCGDDDGNGNWVNQDQGYVSVVLLSN